MQKAQYQGERMKLIEFPKDETNDIERLSQFMDKVKEVLIEEGVTNIVICAKDDAGQGGTSVYANSRADAIEVIWDSLQNI